MVNGTVIPFKSEKKELTEAEIAKINLENVLYRDTLAGNNYQFGVSNGKIGVDDWLQGAYDEVTSSPSFEKRRNKQYQSMKKVYEEEGIFGEPSMPTNADVSAGIIPTIQRSLENITLSDLYGIMSSIDSAVKEYKLPEYGGELSTKDIYHMAEEQGATVEKDGKQQIDIEKLSPELKEALITLETLKQMYGDSCKEDLRNRRRKRYFKMTGEKRDNQFHPKEERPAA